MRWANKRGRDSQCGKHPGTARATASSTAALLPHHWPGHPHAPTPLGLYKHAIQPHRIQRHYPMLAGTTAWKGLFEIISFAHMRTHRECILMRESQDNHSSQVSISWLSEQSAQQQGGGCRTNYESEPGCLWLYQLYLFSSPAPFPLVFPQLSQHSPLHPSTHTYKPAHTVTKETVTSLSTAAIFVARVSLRRA